MTPRAIADGRAGLRLQLLEALAEGEASLSELELRLPSPGGRPEGRSWRAVLEELELLERAGSAASRFAPRLRVWGLTDAGRVRVARRGWRARRCSR